jgi:hypothetical protein
MSETLKHRNIVWLASYPKSGNTWCRLFLAKILFDIQKINNIPIPIYSSKEMIDQYADVDVSELPLNELHQLRLQAFRHQSDETNSIVPVKIHDKFITSYYDLPFLPFENSFIAVYIMRNPLDVCISLSKHLGNTIENTIQKMNTPSYMFAQNNHKYLSQLPQHLDTWSNHVLSWTTQQEIPVYIIKYEDLIENAFETFSNLLNKLNISYTEEQLTNAINFCSFDNLKKKEQEHGFYERSFYSEQFFSTGKAGYYNDILSKQQVETIIHHHYKIMKQYNYAE